MPRAFDISTATTATVDQVHAAFTDRDYWRDRLAEFGGDSIRLDSLDVDGGSITVATTQDLRNNALPVLIAKVVPGNLLVFRKETWRTDGGELHGDVVITTQGAPIAGSAAALVAPTGDGSLLRFRGSVQVKVPLIGGQIEKYISAQITEEIPAVQRFTTGWIAENGSPR
jgi:hypothetical protein